MKYLPILVLSIVGFSSVYSYKGSSRTDIQNVRHSTESERLRHLWEKIPKSYSPLESLRLKPLRLEYEYECEEHIRVVPSEEEMRKMRRAIQI